MKNTADFLDAMRVKLELPSDGKLADYLGMHRQHISRYRTLGHTFDDETCIRVADILEVKPAFVMACMHYQRAKNPKVKDAWQYLGGLAAALAFLAILPFGTDIFTALPADPQSAPLLAFGGFCESAGIYIMRILVVEAI